VAIISNGCSSTAVEEQAARYEDAIKGKQGASRFDYKKIGVNQDRQYGYEKVGRLARYYTCESAYTYNCIKPSLKTPSMKYVSSKNKVKEERLKEIRALMAQRKKEVMSDELEKYPDIALTEYVAPDTNEEKLPSIETNTSTEILSDGKPPEDLTHISAVTFYYDSDVMLPGEEDKVTDSLGALESKNEIWVVGFTDDIGPVSYNKQLALKRASAIRELLAKNAISKKIIKISGHGKCCYTEENSTRDKRSKNRRVEIFTREKVYAERMKALGAGSPQ
jgi:outer membrane protein OmpA-like peptidoglycan-associated protein